ncbi:MAG: hypothetical protein RBT63_00420 [Bdellovibrionales bacterium]|jgi:hypothetical protein|nr:hypothetical protein [Bdellovibrionales bacterium]
MAFTPLTGSEIAVGKAVRNETQEKIRDNFDNHEARINGLETGGSMVYPPLIMRVNGNYAFQPIDQQILITTCNFDLMVTGVFLLLDVAGFSGTTEIDVEYKRGSAAWESVFTTRPSIPSSAGNNAISTNAVLNPDNVEIQAGDLIRLILKSKQSGNPRGLMARIDFNKE